jgi:aminoglycoside 6'-N-acetyltransferase
MSSRRMGGRYGSANLIQTRNARRAVRIYTRMDLQFAPLEIEKLKQLADAPSVRRWGWKPEDVGDDDTATQLSILVDGEVAGLIQYSEELEPDYKSASIDVYLGERFQGRGIGTAAVRMMVEYLMDERGHHRITIDPAVDNERAVRAYAKAGFRTVGVLEAQWRDPDGVWQDALLMEIVRRP